MLKVGISRGSVDWRQHSRVELLENIHSDASYHQHGRDFVLWR